MRTPRLQVRFLLPLLVALVAAAYLSLPVMDRMTLNWFSRDLNQRGVLVAEALSDSIERALQEPPRQTRHLQAVFDRTVSDERPVAVALCTRDNTMVRASSGLSPELGCEAARALSSSNVPQWRAPSGSVHVG